MEGSMSGDTLNATLLVAAMSCTAAAAASEKARVTTRQDEDERWFAVSSV